MTPATGGSPTLTKMRRMPESLSRRGEALGSVSEPAEQRMTSAVLEALQTAIVALDVGRRAEVDSSPILH